MSAEREVKDIIDEVAVTPPAKTKEQIERAHREVTRLMTSPNSSLYL